VQLLHGEAVVGECWFYVNYRGWRALGARYSEIGWEGQPVDGARVIAPEGTETGRLYFDLVCFNQISPGPLADYQQPWAGRPELLREAEKLLFSERDASQNRPWLPKPTPAQGITPQQKADMAKLAERFLPAINRGHKGLDPKALESLRQRMSAYNIHRENGSILGRPVDINPFLPPPDAIPLKEYVTLMADIQRAWRVSAHESPVDTELRQMFIDLCAHLLDQGWGEGSYPGCAESCYETRNWLPVYYSMRDVLAEAGLLRETALAVSWHLGGGRGTLQESPTANMDYLNNMNRALPPCALMLPDESERLQRLQIMQRYLNLVLTSNSVLGPDGCAYHHGTFHFAYASYSMPMPIHIASCLADTGFRLSPEAHQRLKTYVYAMAFAADKYSMPPNVSARTGTPMNCNMAGLAATMAKIGPPDGRKPLDPDMAALHLLLTDKHDNDDARRFREQGIQPQPLTGHWTLNGAAGALHRRDHWLVSIFGMFKFHTGVEIYGWTQTNNYARYARNGSVWVQSSGSPVTAEASGWAFDGWDWCRWPGTTSLIRPAYEIFQGYSWVHNPSPFAGGTSLNGNGIWGMDMGGQDVNFRKSAFCFDNRITVITTGIRSDQERRAVTTLFQNSTDPASEAIWVNGEQVSTFPVERQLPGGQAVWLVDNKRTGYYIHPGGGQLHVARHPQQWTYMIDRFLINPKDNPIISYHDRKYRYKDMAENERYFRPSSGNFALAWLDHGKKPTNAACAYTLVVETTPERMKQFAEDMRSANQAPYEILEQDGRAHILRDRASKTTGYVLFEANESIKTEGALVGNSRPCFVMILPNEQGLLLSVASTDIALKDPIVLRLRGRWTVAAAESVPGQPKVSHQNDETLLEFPYDYYMPMRLALERKGTNPARVN
jgi:chondroitin-sulfate-ABC endolyase/exolyase